MKLKKVVIVGKTNVGKSQLFNRIIGKKHSVVLSSPGITRDRITLVAEWLRYRFHLTDSGGYSDIRKDVEFQTEINAQTIAAISEADLVLFVISKKDGLNSEDAVVAQLLKKSFEKPVILVVNKFDGSDSDDLNYSTSFNPISLGFGQPLHISAEHGINIGQLLNVIIDALQFSPNATQDEPFSTKFSILGKTNVGKSSLCNALLQDERLIVSPIAGTTRDAVDINFSYQKGLYTLIDTPGIRKNKILNKSACDFVSVWKAKQSLKRANVICFVIDIADGIKEIDERIAGLIFKANIPTIIVANKWDLINHKSDEERKKLEKEIRAKIVFLNWAPIVFISAKHSEKILNIFKTLELIQAEINTKIADSDLKRFLIKITATMNPARIENKTITLFKITQVVSQIPTFMITCNDIKYLHFSDSRMIENKLRETFNYRLCPIKIFFRSKKK